MSKKHKHKKKKKNNGDTMSTEEALTRLLGKKAAKRLRELAEGLDAKPGKPEPGKSEGDKPAKRKRTKAAA